MKFIKNLYLDNQFILPNTFWLTVQVLGKQGFMLGVFFLAAHFLSVYDFGLYNYLLAILMLFVLFGDFGISTATSKYVAEFSVVDNEKLKSVLFNATLFISTLLFVVSLIVVIFGPSVLKENNVYIVHLLPSLFFLPLSYLYAGIYRGLDRFKNSSCLTLVASFFSLIIAYPLIETYGIYGAIWANNFFAIILTCLLFWGYREWDTRLDFGLIKKIGSYSIVLGTVSFGYYVYSRTDIILLGQFDYISEIGFYELINKIFLILVAPFMILAQVLSPQITKIYAANNIPLVIQKFKQFILISFSSSLFIAFGAYLSLPFFFESILANYPDAVFSQAFYFLLIILVTQSVAAVAATGFSIATGHARLNMYFLLIFGLINIPLTYFMIKYLGFMGAVYSTVIIRFLTDILFITTYYIILKKRVTSIII
jgi:O-antigen/teichoic acid export membrane protein